MITELKSNIIKSLKRNTRRKHLYVPLSITELKTHLMHVICKNGKRWGELNSSVSREKLNHLLSIQSLGIRMQFHIIENNKTIDSEKIHIKQKLLSKQTNW